VLRRIRAETERLAHIRCCQSDTRSQLAAGEAFRGGRHFIVLAREYSIESSREGEVPGEIQHNLAAPP
jgi:hypothetical protein